MAAGADGSLPTKRGISKAPVTPKSAIATSNSTRVRPGRERPAARLQELPMRMSFLAGSPCQSVLPHCGVPQSHAYRGRIRRQSPAHLPAFSSALRGGGGPSHRGELSGGAEEELRNLNHKDRVPAKRVMDTKNGKPT